MLTVITSPMPMTALAIQQNNQRLSVVTLTLQLLIMAALIRRCSSFAWRPRNPAPFRRILRLQSSIRNPNRLSEIDSLQNDFCVLRHGQSMANMAKIISSNPAVATVQHGLSDTGRQQAQAAGQHVVDYYRQRNYDGIVILASDYLRAKETAEIVKDSCIREGLPLFRNEVIIDTRLRERWFGDWDGGSDQHYGDVWKDDAEDPSHTAKDVESVNAVMDRTTTCVLEWDAEHTNKLILLVAHGDVLQITQTAFAKLDGSLHRTCEHLETATLRPLLLAASSSAESF